MYGLAKLQTLVGITPHRVKKEQKERGIKMKTGLALKSGVVIIVFAMTLGLFGQFSTSFSGASNSVFFSDSAVRAEGHTESESGTGNLDLIAGFPAQQVIMEFVQSAAREQESEVKEGDLTVASLQWGTNFVTESEDAPVVAEIATSVPEQSVLISSSTYHRGPLRGVRQRIYSDGVVYQNDNNYYYSIEELLEARGIQAQTIQFQGRDFTVPKYDPQDLRSPGDVIQWVKMNAPQVLDMPFSINPASASQAMGNTESDRDSSDNSENSNEDNSEDNNEEGVTSNRRSSSKPEEPSEEEKQERRMAKEFSDALRGLGFQPGVAIATANRYVSTPEAYNRPGLTPHATTYFNFVLPGSTRLYNSDAERENLLWGDDYGEGERGFRTVYTGLGYAYIDRGGTPHVTRSMKTALQSSGDGNVYEYNGLYGHGYAMDADMEYVHLRLPNAREPREGRGGEPAGSWESHNIATDLFQEASAIYQLHSQ